MDSPALCILLMLVLAGCATPADDQTVAAPPQEVAAVLLPPRSTTARSASMVVSSLPPIEDDPTRREILLHAALYRAAYDENVGEYTSYYLLDPAPARPGTIDEGAFHLRVLAELSGLMVPIAWAPASPGADPDLFPGTAHLATRLAFRIDERSADGRTVGGELRDTTIHAASSRQGFTARWARGRRFRPGGREPGQHCGYIADAVDPAGDRGAA